MVAESEVPLGTAEPVLFPGAPVVPKGTQRLDHPIFPALKRWAIFGEQDAKYDPITPRVFKLSQYRAHQFLVAQTFCLMALGVTRDAAVSATGKMPMLNDPAPQLFVFAGEELLRQR